MYLLLVQVSGLWVILGTALGIGVLASVYSIWRFHFKPGRMLHERSLQHTLGLQVSMGGGHRAMLPQSHSHSFFSNVYPDNPLLQAKQEQLDDEMRLSATEADGATQYGYHSPTRLQSSQLRIASDTSLAGAYSGPPVKQTVSGALVSDTPLYGTASQGAPVPSIYTGDDGTEAAVSSRPSSQAQAPSNPPSQVLTAAGLVSADQAMRFGSARQAQQPPEATPGLVASLSGGLSAQGSIPRSMPTGTLETTFEADETTPSADALPKAHGGQGAPGSATLPRQPSTAVNQLYSYLRVGSKGNSSGAGSVAISPVNSLGRATGQQISAEQKGPSSGTSLAGPNSKSWARVASAAGMPPAQGLAGGGQRPSSTSPADGKQYNKRYSASLPLFPLAQEQSHDIPRRQPIPVALQHQSTGEMVGKASDSPGKLHRYMTAPSPASYAVTSSGRLVHSNTNGCLVSQLEKGYNAEERSSKPGDADRPSKQEEGRGSRLTGKLRAAAHAVAIKNFAKDLANKVRYQVFAAN